uniref:XRE family transcriptional regulator n=1 Tax=Streptomyces sp. NBC_00093 TaxID=2975649 RepID=A0AAU2ACX5_9ACTN
MREPAEEPVSLHAKKLSERLNRLFEAVHPHGRGPYSNSEVVELMAGRGLETVSDTYLWMLRTGRRDNPTMRHLEALASFFGVPAAYWFDDEVAEKTVQELELLELLRDSQIKNVLLRLSDVSVDGKEAVLGLVDNVRKMEGLPPSN